MTQYCVVSVFDSAMQAFMPPFMVPSTGIAVRSFRDEVNNAESPMHRHPDDYELHHLAVWDDSSGIYDQLSSSIVLIRGKDSIVKSV